MSLLVPQVVIGLIWRQRQFDATRRFATILKNFEKGAVPYNNLRSGVVLGPGAFWCLLLGKRAGAIMLGTGHASGILKPL